MANSVKDLLQQVHTAHEAELKRATRELAEANQRLLKELQDFRDAKCCAPETPPATPPKLLLQVNPTGSRVSFEVDEASPRSRSSGNPKSRCNTEEVEEAPELAPKAFSLPLPLPGEIEPDSERKTDALVVVPEATLSRGASGRLMMETTEAVARLRMGNTLVGDQFDAPPDLKLAAAWRKKSSGTTSKVARTVSSKAHGVAMHEEDDESVLLRLLDRLVLDPSSAKRVAFEVFGLVLIVYDMFWLPMQVFDIPVTTLTEIMGWTSSIYWLVDIPMSFLVGHITRGIIEMKAHAIAKIYLRGWFWFDIVVVSVDWVLNMLEVVNNTKNVGGISALRLGKAVRVLRVFRLIRVLKGGGILQELLDTIHSEHCIIIVGIVKLLGLILCVNHIIACLWFWVGSSEYAVNWITEAELSNRSVAYQYATCLHWSLTQFTPASMEVYPTNEEERFFCVCVIVSAMVIFSSFISAITNAMTQLRNLNKDKIEQFSLLRKYLTQCNVSGGLLARVLQSVSSAMNKNKRRVHEEDIKVLHLLPLSLRQDMNQEVYSPFFVSHPFFSVCSSCFDAYVRKLYSNALKPKFLPSNQEIITSGEQANAMWFVISGALNYKSDRQLSPLPVSITEGKWLSEASLWLFWQHNGIGNTSSESDLVALDANRFQDTFKDDVTVKHYAVVFWSHFMSNPTDLSDVWADEDLLFKWSTEALHLAEQCVGSAIQPDIRNTAFARHVEGRRHSNSAMLDESLMQGHVVPAAENVDSP